MDQVSGDFIWDTVKESSNVLKHGVDFRTAAAAFQDPLRKIFTDSKHSADEPRYFCIGRVGDKILTVRFAWRHGKIRIIGAGWWRKGNNAYEKAE